MKDEEDSQALQNDNRAELARLVNPFDPRVQAMSATERLRSLLDVPGIERLIPTLPIPELFLLIHDVGLDDSVELLRYASPEQWAGFVDLGCWQRDNFTIEYFTRYHSIASEAGPLAPRRLIEAIDPELIALSILRRASVFDAREAPEDIPDGRARMISPDGLFVLELDEGDPNRLMLGKILDTIYSADVDRGRQLLQACRFELPSQLEETAYQFRTARLEELGFPPLEEAAAIEAPLPRGARAQLVARVRAETSAENTSTRPFSGTAMSLGPHSPLLLRVLSDLPDGPRRDKLLAALRYLVNRRMVFRGLDLSDSELITNETKHVVRTTSLGLLALMADSNAGAEVVLASLQLDEIYRLAVTQLAALTREAGQILDRASAPIGASPFDAATTEKLEGLSMRPPRRPVTEEERRDSSAPDLLVPLATLDEVRAGERLLFEARTLLSFFEQRFDWGPERMQAPDLAVLPAETHPMVRFTALLLTGIANVLLDRGRDLAPLEGADVADMMDMLLEGRDARRIDPNFRRRAMDQLTGIAGGLEDREREVISRFLATGLDELQATLGRLPPDAAPDARFLGDVLLLLP